MKKFSEEYNQIFVAGYFKKLQLIRPDFMFFHCPNGGSRGKSEASRLKMMGVLPGVPDITLIGKARTHFIELKKEKGTLSAEQKEFIRQATGFGINVSVIYSDHPADLLPKIEPIMTSLFGYTVSESQSSMSSILKSPMLS